MIFPNPTAGELALPIPVPPPINVPFLSDLNIQTVSLDGITLDSVIIPSTSNPIAVLIHVIDTYRHVVLPGTSGSLADLSGGFAYGAGVTADVDLGEPAWKRLACRTFLPHEVPSLIEATLMSDDVIKVIGNLCGDNAQTFVDVIHEVPSPPLHFQSMV